MDIAARSPGEDRIGLIDEFRNIVNDDIFVEEVIRESGESEMNDVADEVDVLFLIFLGQQICFDGVV